MDTHWDYSLQADVEVLFLVGFEFFQGNSGFSDKLVVAKFVLITHGDPGGKKKKGTSTRGTGKTKKSPPKPTLDLDFL